MPKHVNGSNGHNGNGHAQNGNGQHPTRSAPSDTEAQQQAAPRVKGRFDFLYALLISASFHMGLLVAGVFVYMVAAAAISGREVKTIIVPNAFDDPAFSEHPGGPQNPGASGDPTREAAQDLKQMAKSEGWAQNTSQDVASLVSNSGTSDVVGIFAGSGAKSTASGDSGAAAYGTPGGGAGAGPRSSFYGTGGNAKKIVYILDHSGSMLDNFDFLKKQAKKSVNALVPLQYFAVIMVSDKVTVAGGDSLQQALPDSKKRFGDAISQIRAEGQNDGLLAPFDQAFSRAFAMKPDLIYFLSDGKFGDGLIDRINKLNKDKSVHINTIAFVTEEPDYKAQLQQLAKDNGGSYKFIPEKDLEQ